MIGQGALKTWPADLLPAGLPRPPVIAAGRLIGLALEGQG
jgi:hypothetical protein